MRRSQILGLAGSALAARALPALAQETPAIRLGLVGVEEGAAADYALQRGFYQQAGLNVELTRFPNGATVAQGVVAGALDVGVTNSGSMSLAHERGLPVDLLACLALYTPGSPLSHFVVAKKSEIRSAKDLSGKTVAISALRDMIHVSALAWIDDNGGDSKSVNFIEVPFPQMATAIAAHRVDAATIVEPFYTRSRRDLDQIGLNYRSVNEGRPFQTLGLIGNRAFIEKNTSAARKMVTALHGAARWANGNRYEAARLLAPFTKMEPSVIAAYPRVAFAEVNNAAYVQPVVDLMTRYGVLRKRFEASELFSTALA